MSGKTRLKIVLSGALLLFCSVTVRAMDVELAVGGNLTDFYYAEQPPAPKSTESAVFPAFSAEGRLYFTHTLYLQLDYMAAVGVTSRYDGTNLLTMTPVTATDNLAFWNGEADVYVPLFDTLSFYVGYGYRNWNRFLAGNPGYTENYSWYYSPVGLYWVFLKGSNDDLGVDISARPTNHGIIKVITSATYPGGQDSQMDLGAVLGWKVMVPFNWHLTDQFGLRLAPWYEHSEIGQSNIVPNATLAPTPGTGIQEPSSKTDQFGLDALVTFRF